MTIEKRGDGTGSASARGHQLQHRVDDPGGAGERDLGGYPRHPLGVIFDHLELAADLAEFGVAGKGQLKIIEDHSERMARLAARIPMPGVAWAIDAVIRLASARRG